MLRRIGKPTLVVGDPDAFNPKFKAKPVLKYVGSPFKPLDVESANGVLLLAKNQVKLAPGITTTGRMERTTEFEEVGNFFQLRTACFKRT